MLLVGAYSCSKMFDEGQRWVQVDADPSNRKRVALRSEHDIARMTGRSNIVSKVPLCCWLSTSYHALCCSDAQ